MKRWAWMVLFAGLMSTSMAHAAYTVGELMAELAQNTGGRARFVEKRFVALLNKPVVASGEMVYSPPERLEKHTLLPRPESMVLDKDTLSLERDKRRMSINLSSRPEARAFVESVRNTLAGNQQALEAHYRLEIRGVSADWTLTLVPTEPAIATLLQRITVSGNKKQVRYIEYLQTDGDRSELTIDPLE